MDERAYARFVSRSHRQLTAEETSVVNCRQFPSSQLTAAGAFSSFIGVFQPFTKCQ